MLAEKFVLILETLIRHIADTAQYPDGGPKVVSQARHVPIKLPEISKPAMGRLIHFAAVSRRKM
jgi:hypothetical protein